jgi:hypothetical protein
MELDFSGMAPTNVVEKTNGACSSPPAAGIPASLGRRPNSIAEINEKADLNISLESLGRSKHRRVTTLTFTIKAQAIQNGDSKASKS